MNINLLNAGLLLLGATFTPFVVAETITWDDYSVYQSVLDKANDNLATWNTVSTGFSSADIQLTNASRTFSATAVPGKAKSATEIYSDTANQLIHVSNKSESVGRASIEWRFDPVNFVRISDGFWFDVENTLDLNVTAEIVVNGQARSGSKVFTSSGGYVFEFADFSNNSVFSQVSSISLNLTGPSNWDGAFRLALQSATLPSIPASSVPLPPAYLMMGTALLGFVVRANRRAA